MPTAVTEELKKGSFHFVQLLDEEQYQMGVKGLSNIEILRTCMIHDRGLEITTEMMDEFIAHFNENVYGTELQVNLDHNRGGEAAGWIKNLFKKEEEGCTTLMATVEWTPLGIDKITNKLYRFTSSELALEHPHHKTGEWVKNVLIGVALTNIPAVKGMAPVELSEQAQAFINQSYMDKLKAKFEELNAKDKVSFAEYQEFKNMAFMHKNASQTSQMLSELEEKAEAAPEAPATPEAPAEEPKAEEPAPATEEAPAAPEALTEKAQLVSLAEENRKLREELAIRELTETVATDLCLSETRKVGFTGNKETINRVAKFMAKLSQAQRSEFTAILGEVRTVDLSTRGVTPKPSAKVELNDENIVALAEKLMKSGEAKNITEAQKMAKVQLSEGNK